MCFTFTHSGDRKSYCRALDDQAQEQGSHTNHLSTFPVEHRSLLPWIPQLTETMTETLVRQQRLLQADVGVRMIVNSKRFFVAGRLPLPICHSFH